MLCPQCGADLQKDIVSCFSRRWAETDVRSDFVVILEDHTQHSHPAPANLRLPYREMEDQTKGGADFSLVSLMGDKPSCKIHGAMNKVTPSPPGFWRCLQGICRAGCQEA